MNGAASHQRTAVVIDGEPGARSLLTGTLVHAGFTVHSASTVPAGVELVREYSPAVTTLDLDTPGMEWCEAVTHLRASSDTYLILVAARSSERDMIAAYRSGADGYVTKPVRALELRARVDAMLRRPRLP